MSFMEMAPQRVANPLLQHYDYPALDQVCTCLICVDWRKKRAVFHDAQIRVDGHDRSCMCADCKAMRSVRTAFHAADERRNLFCEVSFHASEKSLPDGVRVMEWLHDELTSGRRTDGWWEGRAPYYPLSYWFMQAKKGVMSMAVAVSGAIAVAVSGAVQQLAAAAVSGASGFTVLVGPIPTTDQGGCMKIDLVAGARAEAADLREKLEQMPIYRQLRTLEKFIEDYVPEPATIKVTGVSGEGKISREAVVEAAARFLLVRNGPAFAKEILPAIKAEGIKVGGNKEARNLANILSRSGRFSYAKETGFSIAPSSEGGKQ